jgi:steroid delta-isomerase-like uncharacterized protein
VNALARRRRRYVSARENKRIARRVFDDIWSKGRLELTDELLAPDFVGRPGGLGEPFEGPEGAREFVTLLREGFPDISFDVESMIGEDELVAARWVATGTHDGEFMGVEASSRPVKFGGMTMLRFEDGMVRDGWTDFDALTMLRQIGAVGEPLRS